MFRFKREELRSTILLCIITLYHMHHWKHTYHLPQPGDELASMRSLGHTQSNGCWLTCEEGGGVGGGEERRERVGTGELERGGKEYRIQLCHFSAALSSIVYSQSLHCSSPDHGTQCHSILFIQIFISLRIMVSSITVVPVSDISMPVTAKT